MMQGLQLGSMQRSAHYLHSPLCSRSEGRHVEIAWQSSDPSDATNIVDSARSGLDNALASYCYMD